jgi:hypothetical protein
VETEKVFRTKTGYCHVLPDKIVLTRNGIIGNLSKVAVGNHISRSLIISALIAIWLLYLAFSHFMKDERFISLICLLVATFLIQAIFKSWNNCFQFAKPGSAAPIIERSSIKSAAFRPARKGLTRAYFEILFENANGKIKKRLIMLPGSLVTAKQKPARRSKL